MSDWHVGQKVVCIIDHWNVGPFDENPKMPTVGQVYTIRDITPVFSDGLCAFRFEEIINKPIRYGNLDEPMFHQKGFRPVVSQHADISVFTSILDRVNSREVADA